MVIADDPDFPETESRCQASRVGAGSLVDVGRLLVCTSLPVTKLPGPANTLSSGASARATKLTLSGPLPTQGRHR